MRAVTCLVAMALLAACSRTDPEQLAVREGLAPPPVNPDAPVSRVKPSADSRLGKMLAVSPQYAGARMPLPPPPPSFETMSQYTGYDGWESDRVDATSFDALTNSLNVIMQKMGPILSEDFDRVVKYVLLQVPKDPMVARAAAGGGKMSDAELLQTIQSYVHGRTPREITDLAQQMYERQQAQQKSPQARALAGFTPGSLGTP